MAPTRDERRDVAERLRENGRVLREIDADIETAALTLDDVLGVGHTCSWQDAFDMLADFIDPTCHMTREYADTELGRVFQGWLCDECMCTADVLDASEPPEYCPHCGARVTRGGDE